MVTPLVTNGVQVPYSYTGSGKGFSVGAFDIGTSIGVGHVLHSVTLAASGFGGGDDSLVYSEVGLFMDTDNNGAFNSETDQRYGQQYSAFPSDDGNLTFSQDVGISSTAPKRFFVVVKLSGPLPPQPDQILYISVTGATGTGGSVGGVPTAIVASIRPLGGPTPLRLEYHVTGAGVYNYVFRWVLDNNDNSWLAGQEWSGPVFGQAAFDAPGTIPFASWVTDSACFPVGTYVTTFWSTMTLPSGMQYTAPLLFDNVAPQQQYWTPAYVGDELTWWGTCDTLLDHGEMTWNSRRPGGASIPGSATLEPAYRVGDYIRVVAVPAAVTRPGPLETGSGAGFLMGAFDLIAHSNAATLSSLTLAALGTGDDASAFSEVRLYVDTNGNGAFDPGVDTPFGAAYTAFPADNGSLTFNDTLNLAINETKRLLVVCKLNGAVPASYGQTFQARVTAINATGQNHSGLPTAAVAGLRIHAPAITVTTTGANLSAFANGQGPGGLGLGVAEFLLHNTGVNVATFGSITLAAGGSLFDHLAFSQVALYEDSNNSFQFDVGDTLYGAAAAGFSGDDGNLTFTQAATLAQGQWRRYFLVVKLNGTATVGDDFWVRVASLGVTGGTEAPSLGTLEQAFTIIPGSDPIGGTGGGTGGGSGGSKDSGGCIAGAANLLPLPILLAITRRRRARQAFARR